MTLIVKSKRRVGVPPAAPRRAAGDEYTREQRRVIDARLKNALQEVKQGHRAGPFNSADEMIASLKRELKKSGTKKLKPSSQ